MDIKEYEIEICANSVESALEAERGGAQRVELCAGMPEGGTTPSYGEMVLARELLGIKLYVIIRPRGGDFLYSALEQQVMLRDIETAVGIGVDGIVVGCLTSQGGVDMELMRRVMVAAGGLPVTFHRAFDMCRDPYEALEDIVSLGCKRILTSGQHLSAEAGIAVLRQLVELAGQRIIIMPGCGVNTANIRKIAIETGAREFHLSARKSRESSMVFRNPVVSMGGIVKIDEYRQDVTAASLVREAVEALK